MATPPFGRVLVLACVSESESEAISSSEGCGWRWMGLLCATPPVSSMDVTPDAVVMEGAVMSKTAAAIANALEHVFIGHRFMLGPSASHLSTIKDHSINIRYLNAFESEHHVGEGATVEVAR